MAPECKASILQETIMAPECKASILQETIMAPECKAFNTARNQVSLQYQPVKPQYCKKLGKFMAPECKASILEETR